VFPKIKLPIFLALLISLLFSAGFSSSRDGKQYLAQGDFGIEVRILQEQLKQLGYFQVPATGYFGPLTARAIINLQKDYGLQIDGLAGPQTHSLINNLLQNNQDRQRSVQGYCTSAEGPLPASLTTLFTQGSSLTQVAPFWYQLDPRGNGKLIHHAEVSQEEVHRLIKTARAQKVKVLALVHNLQYNKENVNSREVTHQVLSSKENRQTLIENILSVIQENGLEGIEIDLENICSGDRYFFNQLIKELSEAFTPKKYYLSVALPARLDEQANVSWSGSFDYATIGHYAQQVVIMAYDEHGTFSKAGPIASLPWVEEVIRCALREIPPSKLVLGIPAYGFDWNYDQPAPRYISYALAIEIARRHQKTINWEQSAQVPFFTYVDENGSTHDVYFENASSWAGKLDLVAKYNLRGIAIWRLGLEDPKGWEVLKSKFPVLKL
jgi:spore germination protein YaaH